MSGLSFRSSLSSGKFVVVSYYMLEGVSRTVEQCGDLELDEIIDLSS